MGETGRTVSHDGEDLERRLSTAGALGANIIDMVGVGPFITLPLIVTAMGGPQAMLGWVLGALLSLADGCTWAELGTTFPRAGGSYAYMRAAFSPRLGKALAFLYAWQLLISAPLSIASGCIGFAQYAGWFFPSFGHSGQTALALAALVVCTAFLFQSIARIGAITKWLGMVVIGTLVAVILIGFTHFSPSQAFSFPRGAFRLDAAFFNGLGAGLLVAAYDYWGYYNVCFLGGEVRHPQRTIPRAVIGSICVVGLLYLLMNVSVLGLLPWQSLIHEEAGARQYTIAVFTQTAFAQHAWALSAATCAVILIAVASLASVFALLLGYSRIPFAAARDGNFPAVFGKLHARHHFPVVSLLTLGGIAAVCCLFRLQEVIASLVVLRILFQFLLQGVAVLLPQHRRNRQQPGSFRMPLYPLPSVAALLGFLYILFSRPKILGEFRLAMAVAVTGLMAYGIREYRTRLRGVVL